MKICSSEKNVEFLLSIEKKVFMGIFSHKFFSSIISTEDFLKVFFLRKQRRSVEGLCKTVFTLIMYIHLRNHSKAILSFLFIEHLIKGSLFSNVFFHFLECFLHTRFHEKIPSIEELLGSSLFVFHLKNLSP